MVRCPHSCMACERRQLVVGGGIVSLLRITANEKPGVSSYCDVTWSVHGAQCPMVRENKRSERRVGWNRPRWQARIRHSQV